MEDTAVVTKLDVARDQQYKDRSKVVMVQQREDVVKANTITNTNTDAIKDVDFNENVTKQKMAVNVLVVKPIDNGDDGNGISIIKAPYLVNPWQGTTSFKNVMKITLSNSSDDMISLLYEMDKAFVRFLPGCKMQWSYVQGSSFLYKFASFIGNEILYLFIELIAIQLKISSEMVHIEITEVNTIGVCADWIDIACSTGNYNHDAINQLAKFDIAYCQTVKYHNDICYLSGTTSVSYASEIHNLSAVDNKKAFVVKYHVYPLAARTMTSL